MGYGFSAMHRLKDEETIFYTECMYAYEPVFKKCIESEKGIYYFSGRVTKQKIKDFSLFLDKFSEKENNMDSKRFTGNMSNITHKRLIEDFTTIYNLMLEGKCKYLSIG